MKKSLSLILMIFFLFLSVNVTAQVKDHPGKKVFMDAKCQTCHTVESHEITSKSKKAVDLSNVGAIYRANFLESFLMKNEKINDKAHPQTFKGSKEDLHQLAEWMQTLNTGGEGKEGKADKKETKAKTGTDTKETKTKDTTKVK
jgi:cytochrome c553